MMTCLQRLVVCVAYPSRRLTRPWLATLGVSVWALGLASGVQAASSVSPKVYIGLFKDNVVAVLDTRTNRVSSTIPIPAGPHGLVITPDGKKVYVSSDGASTVSVIDTMSDTVLGHIEVGPNPHGLAMSPDGQRLLVAAFGANALLLIDTASDKEVSRIAVPMPHNSVASADGLLAYVASQKQGETAVVIVDLKKQTQVGRVALEKTPRALALSHDGTLLYVTLAGTDAVQVVDPTQQRVVGQVPVGASPHLAVMIPQSTDGLAVSQGPGTLERFSAAPLTVSQTVSVGKAPHWVAVSSDGRLAYVTNEGSHDLTVVDLVKNVVTATVPVGNAPRKIAIQAGAILPQAGALETPPPPTRTSVAAADHGTLDVTGKTSVEIEADDSYFAPTWLTGLPGQALELVVENESGALHNFSLAAQQIDVDIPPHGKSIVKLVFPSTGSVRFFCKIHEALGMHGALQISSAPTASGVVPR